MKRERERERERDKRKLLTILPMASRRTRVCQHEKPQYNGLYAMSSKKKGGGNKEKRKKK